MSRPSTLGSGLVWAFGTSVAMWCLAFIGHIPGIPPLPAALGVGLLAVQFLGAFLSRSAAVGAIAGLGTATVNLLALLSVLTTVTAADDAGRIVAQEPIPGAAVYIAGYLGTSLVLGSLGGWIGSRVLSKRPDSGIEPLPRFAIVTAIAVLPLLFVGGLVTSAGAGMAVPDWPNSYSANMFLFPLSRMTGGIFLEHAHRLFGSFVGLIILTQTIWVLIGEPRGRIKLLALGLLLLVIGQGVLGGYRVVENSKWLGFFHGVLGQVTFAYAVSLAVMMSRTYREAGGGAAGAIAAEAEVTAGAASVHSPIRPGIAIATLVLLLIQLAFGAMFRHVGSKHALWSHVLFALLPTVMAMIAAFSAGRGKDGTPAQRLIARMGKGMVHTTAFQLLLGGAALWAVVVYANATEPALPRVLLGTLHQFNGALLLAMSTVVTVMACRLGSKRK